MNDQDEWLNAVTALIARGRGTRNGNFVPDPDPKPLAALLRSERPIPRDIRDTFAELLDPQEPFHLHCCLEFRDTQTEKKGFRAEEKTREIAADFLQRRKKGKAEGKLAEESYEETGGKFNIDPRTVRRHMKHLVELCDKLRGDK